jgi:hypothetical protein
MKKIQDKHLNIRLDKELYQKYVNLAIKKSTEEIRIVSVSEIIREVLEKGVN